MTFKVKKKNTKKAEVTTDTLDSPHVCEFLNTALAMAGLGLMSAPPNHHVHCSLPFFITIFRPNAHANSGQMHMQATCSMEADWGRHLSFSRLAALLAPGRGHPVPLPWCRLHDVHTGSLMSIWLKSLSGTRPAAQMHVSPLEFHGNHSPQRCK